MGSSYNFGLKTQKILTVLLVYIWILDFACISVSQASPKQVAKGSTSPRLLSSFGEAEFAKQNVELCPGPGAGRSGES